MSIAIARAPVAANVGQQMKLWRGQSDNWEWKPSTRDIARIWLGLALVFLSLTLVSVLNPSNEPATGRWGWVHRAFQGAFGANGDIVLYASLGGVCLVYGVLKFRSAQ